MKTICNTPRHEVPPRPVTGPDPLVAAFRDRIRPGARILDIGVGSGRNALPLARSGLTVVGIDPAAEALERTAAAAAAEGLTLELHRTTFQEYEPDGPFDVVLCLDLMSDLSRADCASLIHRLHAWTAPGSLLLLTARHVDDPSYDRVRADWERVGLHSFRAPDGRRRTYLARGVVRNLFRSWKILHHHEEVESLHRSGAGGGGHRGGIVELAAVRKLV